MAAAKVLEGTIYCETCKTSHGKIWRKEVREGFYENSTEPKKAPKYCPVCESVLVRRTDAV